jgi:hypothetical protein
MSSIHGTGLGDKEPLPWHKPCGKKGYLIRGTLDRIGNGEYFSVLCTPFQSIAIAQKGKMGTAQLCFEGNTARTGFGG